MMIKVAELFKPGGPFFLIAGPCVLEDDELHLEIARVLCAVRRSFGIPVIFKASFDKANRSQWGAPRGPGIVHGLEMLMRVKEETHSQQWRGIMGLPVLTDFHEPGQAEAVAEVCDVLQVPAALCRQTDMLQAAAGTGRPVNLKKGQWVGTIEMQGAVAKMRAGRDYPVAITERGTFFGYGDLVADMRNISRLYEACGVPVIFDATHAVQRPGLGGAGASGGNRDYIEPLARAAVAAGADGLFLEVHPRPGEAPSDGDCMLPLDRLLPLMSDVMAIRRVLDRDRA